MNFFVYQLKRVRSMNCVLVLKNVQLILYRLSRFILRCLKWISKFHEICAAGNFSLNGCLPNFYWPSQLGVYPVPIKLDSMLIYC